MNPTINEQIAPEIVQAIIAQAAARGLSINDYLRDLLGLTGGERQELALAEEPQPRNEENDFDPEAGLRAVAALINRSPEQISAAKARAIKEFKPIRELPADVSPLEVMPVIRGNETDEEVIQALKDLS